MKRGVKIKLWATDPISVIEYIVSIVALVGALHLFTPLYEHTATVGTTGLLYTLSSIYMVWVWGAILIVASLLVLYGLIRNKPQVKGTGWFLMILARTFQLISAIIFTGLLPLSPWIYILTILLVVIVLWFKTKAEIRHART